MAKFLITGADYQRIFRTIYSVLENDLIDPTGACLYFNTIAAIILNEHYGILAKPVVGNAAYVLDGKTDCLLIFADIESGVINRGGENFHCWVEADGWLLDFMAPLFSVIAKNHNLTPCDPKMMCKPLRKSKDSLNDLHCTGDFFLWPNQERTLEEVQRILAKPAVVDLAQICLQWFRRPPLPMTKAIQIGNQRGEIAEVNLKDLKISGSW